MVEYDIESLLGDVSGENPCGEDISYDPDFLALEQMLQPKASGMIDIEQDVAEPKWSEVVALSTSLLQRSKDLRVSVYLAVGLLKKNGFPGMGEGLAVLKGLLERFWDGLYPQLDPDDDNDPLERINALASLSPESVSAADPFKFKQRVMETPLCNSRQAGRFCFRDVQIAKGAITVSEEASSSAPGGAVIDAAFQDTSMEELETISTGVNSCIDSISAITDVFTRQAVDGQSPDLNDLRTILEKIRSCVKEYLGDSGDQTETGEGAADGGAAASSVSGEIRSSQDAVKMLDRVSRYFEKHEPSSPVPLLLRRAKKLVSKNFVDIVADFCPDGMSQVDLISGRSPEGNNASGD